MKILCIGDPHFRTNNAMDTDALCKRVLEKIESIRPRFVVVLGDVLDRHETIHVSPLERATRFLKLISEKTELYVLIGNHDRPNNSTFLTVEHPFTALKYWPHTYVVDSTLDKVIDGHRFVFVPYVYPGRFFEALTYSHVLSDRPKTDFLENEEKKEKNREETAIEVIGKAVGFQVKEEKKKEIWKDDYIMQQLSLPQPIAALFAHQEFKGAKMGAITSEIGDVWLSHYPFMMSGHIHEYDELQPNLIYSGTAYYTNWGETHSKSISLLHLEDENRVKHERIDMKLPKKQLIHIDANAISEYEPPKGDQMKIIISGTFAEIRAAMKSSKMKQWKEDGIIVCVKEKNVEDETERGKKQNEYKTFQQLLSERVQGLNNEYMSLTFQEILQ